MALKKFKAIEKRLLSSPAPAAAPFRITVNAIVDDPFTFKGITGSNGSIVNIETRISKTSSGHHYESKSARAYVFAVKDLYEICSNTDVKREFEREVLRVDCMVGWSGIFVETDRGSLRKPPPGATVTPDTVDRWVTALAVRWRGVPWVWCSDRRDCEIAVYRHLHAACGTDTDAQLVRRAMKAYQTGWKAYLLGLPAKACPGPATQEGAWWGEGFFDCEETYGRLAR